MIKHNGHITAFLFRSDQEYVQYAVKQLKKEKTILCQLHAVGEFKQMYLTLPYCEVCGVPSGDGYIPHDLIISGRKCLLEYFRIVRSDTPEIVNRKMHTAPEHSYLAKDFTIEIKRNTDYTKNIATHLIGILAEDKDKCPKCSNTLSENATAECPLNNKNYLIVNGRFCSVCKKVYVSDAHLVKGLIDSKDIIYVSLGWHPRGYRLYIFREDKDEFFKASQVIQNVDADDYRSNLEAIQRIVLKAEELNSGYEYILLNSLIKQLLAIDLMKQSKLEVPNETHVAVEQAKEKPKDGKTPRKREIERYLSNRKPRINSSFLGREKDQPIVKFTVEVDGKKCAYSVINEKADEDKNRNILHYSDEMARELMTAAFKRERNNKGECQEKKIRILRVEYGSGDLENGIVADTVWIKRDGGMVSSTLNKNGCELVDLMLYSPYTGRYELITATHNTYSGEVYIDINLIREFVKLYGNPGVNFKLMNSSYGYSGGFDDLNDESILKELGYTVNKESDLSREQRRALLEDIVDLKILTVSKIISLLKFFIAAHSAPKDLEARLKWTQ